MENTLHRVSFALGALHLYIEVITSPGFSHMRRNAFILIAIFSVLVLGMVGQYRLDADQFFDSSLHALYQVVMLFVLEGEWTLGQPIPWELEVARVLAPMVTIGGVIIVITQDAWIRLSNLLIQLWDGHVVVVGLGEKGFQFARSCKQQHRVVVIEKDETNPRIERARAEGIHVLVGDALDDRNLRAAMVKRARHVVTFCGNDGTSVEISLRIRDLLARLNANTAMRIHLHVNSTRVSSRLEGYSKFYHDRQGAEVSFFSVHDLNARILLRKYPPDVFANVQGQQQVHFAIYNFGHFAEHILTEAVRICHFLNGKPLRFTIFDVDAKQRVASLLKGHPGLTQLCDIEYVDLPTLSELELDHVSDALLQSVTEHVICKSSDEENLELALMLRTILLSRPGCNAPINLRMQHASGLAKLLEAEGNDPEVPDGIYPFGMLDEVLDYDNILSDRLDTLAQAMHEDYLARRQGVSSDARLYSGLNEWINLAEPVRKSNRLQADHLHAKLRAIRCSLGRGSPNGFEFTHDEAEYLARIEHARWRANKVYEGWREGSERIEGAKINPMSVRWEQLDPGEREQQVEAIKRLPRMLESRLGWCIERDFFIGVTGHRPNRVDLSDKALQDKIDRALREIKEANPGRRFVVVSPLAEGTDRVVARMAMERHGMALQAPLPLPFELYQTDFEDTASIREFMELVGKSEDYFELPMRFGTIETLASHVDGGSNLDRARQYAFVGAYIVQTCDELIGVYDGGESAGIGGTVEVLEWRAAGKVPDEYRLDSDFFLRPTVSPPKVIDSPPLAAAS